MTSGLKIIVAEDHPMVRDAMAQTLRALFDEPHIIPVESQAALDRAATAHPDTDLVLLDLNMPGARGFSSLLQLRASDIAWRVVVISAYAGSANIRRAKEFGAVGFIPKSAPVDVLQDALHRIVAGETWFPPLPDAGGGDPDLAARLAELTPQQLRVLTALADGLLNKQIAYDLGLAENTVKVHVSAVLRKLGINSRTQAALIARALDPSVEGDGN